MLAHACMCWSFRVAPSSRAVCLLEINKRTRPVSIKKKETCVTRDTHTHTHTPRATLKQEGLKNTIPRYPICRDKFLHDDINIYLSIKQVFHFGVFIMCLHV